MLVGFVVLVASTLELCGQTSMLMSQEAARTGRVGIAIRADQVLFLPICLVILCFSMDSLHLGLRRSGWSAWGALGLAGAVFLAQAMILLVAEQHFAPLLVALLATPWLVRKAFPASSALTAPVPAP